MWDCSWDERAGMVFKAHGKEAWGLPRGYSADIHASFDDTQHNTGCFPFQGKKMGLICESVLSKHGG